MKTKLLTLLTLLVTCVTGAWSADGGKATRPSTSLDLASQTTYTPDANGWIVFDPYTIAGSPTWWTITTKSNQTTGADYTAEGSTFTAPFSDKASDAASIKINYTGSYSSAIRFTGVEKASFLVHPRSSKTFYVGLYSFDGESESLVEEKSAAGNAYKEIIYPSLSPSTTYIAYFYGKEKQNMSLVEVALKKVAVPGAIDFSPAAGSVETGSNITLSSSGANTILYQWGASTVDGDGDWSGATIYSNETKPVVPSVGSSNNVLSVKATNTNGSTCGSATYTITAAKTVTTTTINSSGITHLDVKSGTAAGTLSASVTAGGSPVGGATVTWASSDESIVKVGETTGVVTLVAAGTAHITATYAGDETYAASSDDYEIDVVDTRKQVTLSFSETSITDYNFDGETLTAPTLTAKDQSDNTIDLAELPELSFAVDKEDIVTVNATTGAITAANTNNFGTSTVTVSFLGNSNYKSAASKSYTVTRAPMLYQVKFDNGFEGFIEEGTKKVNVFYMAGTSAPSQTGTIKKASGYEASVVGNTVVLTKDTHTKTYNIVATAKTPFEGAGKQTFSAVPSYVASVYGYTSDKGLKFSKQANLDESKTDWTREAKGNSRLYFFVGAAESITLTYKGESRAVKVSVNGGEAEEKSGTFTVNLNEDQFNMVEIQSNQTSGDGGYQDMTLTSPKQAVTVGANGYTTFASTNKLDLTDENRPTGLKAYKATREDANLTFTALNQAVPAGTGLLLLGETKGGTYYIPIASESTDVDGNALVGVTTPTAKQSVADDTYYFVMKKAADAESALEFAPLSTSAAVTIPAGKAYVEVPNTAFVGARELSISFDDGETTGIDAMHNSQCIMHNEYYNLNGQRVAKPTKGLYIVNGRKVVIK